MKWHRTRRSLVKRIAFYYLICLASLLVLCLRLIGAQTILAYASTSKPYSVLLTENCYRDLLAEDATARIICFGDSNSYYPPDTSMQAGNYDLHLPELIRQAVGKQTGQPGIRFAEWAYPSAGIFDYYCLYYEALKFSPDLIIVPINWRFLGSFSIQKQGAFDAELMAFIPLRDWFRSSQDDGIISRGASLMKQIEYKIRRYFLYPIGIKAWALESFRYLVDSRIRDTVFLKFVENPTAAIRRSPGGPERENVIEVASEFVNAPDAETLRRFFPMRIADSNARFLNLCALADGASKRGTRILFYIWPLDYEYLAQLGVLDESAFDRSKLLIMRATDKKNIHFVDLSGLLEHKYFYDYVGHCAVEGRRKIAEALAPEILEILKDDGAGRF